MIYSLSVVVVFRQNLKSVNNILNDKKKRTNNKAKKILLKNVALNLMLRLFSNIISLIIFFQSCFSTDRSLALSVRNVLSPSAIHVHIYWIPSLWDQSFGHQRSITNGNIRMAL